MKNENEVEETTKTNDEELEENEELEETSDEEELEEEDSDDSEEDDDNDTPTLSDYEELQKKLKTIEAQKEHWRKKATSKPLKKEETKETNTEQVRETDVIELARLASKGYSDEEISLLKDIKTLKGLNNLADAIETPLFKANLKEKQDREKRDKASLNASGKPLAYKSGKEPSVEELKKAWTGR